MNFSFEKQKLVRFQHCDPAGIVFYPQYFVLFHELIEDWFNDGLEVNYGKFIQADRLGVPTVRIEVDFTAPSTIGDTLTMRLAVRKVGRSSLTLSLAAFVDEERRVHIEQTLVLLSLDSHKSIEFPHDLRLRIERFVIRNDKAE